MKKPSTYLKLRVLGAIEYASGTSIKARIQKVSESPFMDEEGHQRTFTWRTIQTWYSRYKKDGITTMKPQERCDKGKRRKISPEEVSEAIEQALPLLKSDTPSKSLLYRICVEKNFLRADQIARTTFFRFVTEYEFLKKKEVKNKMRLAFAKQYANELWQGDTMMGPFVTKTLKNKTTKKQAKLIAFIDDASRVVTHGQFYFDENTESLIDIFQTAFYKRGVPDSIYVDNGSIYVCKEINLICGRVGSILRHAPVQDGAAKGKIERFFRTVRGSFLAKKLDLSSLNALNKQFHSWLEEDYNSKVHSSLQMKPIDRFNLDLKRIRFLSPNEVTDELFFFEEERKVKKDNTFSVKNTHYEAPRDLRSRTIQVRYNRYKVQKIVVYYKGERMGEARKLNLILNARLYRRGEKK